MASGPWQIARDTAAHWASSTRILAQGEPALETDTGQVKYGDGASLFSALPYSADGVGSAAAAQAAAIAAAAADATTKVNNETTRAQEAEALLAPLDSPAFTNNPTALTQAVQDSSTRLATTAYVDRAVGEVTTGSGGGYVGIDTDGTPYIDRSGQVPLSDAAAIGIDTDGFPYFVALQGD